MFMIWFDFFVGGYTSNGTLYAKNMKNIAGLLLGDLVCLNDNSVIK